MQNTSHAVMAQRSEPADSLDHFPTPPWATRALFAHVLHDDYRRSVWEPACGEGHMSKVLREYFASVVSSDIHDYGYQGSTVADFLTDAPPLVEPDWIITNPPFRLAEDFILRAREVARHGVAMLVRTTFIEGVGRYERLFSRYPPTAFAQFTERVPMVKGRLDPKASTATGYSWLVWTMKPRTIFRPLVYWIPPCRRDLERAGDYETEETSQ